VTDLTPEERQRLKRLNQILGEAKRGGVRHLTAKQLRLLPALYRYASSVLARLEARDADTRTLENVRLLLLKAHGLLYRDLEHSTEPWLVRAWNFFMVDCPRQVRAEWKLLGGTFLLLYGLALISFFAVREDLSLAYSFLNPEMVDSEIEQLRETEEGQPFRGNFTFGLEDSASAGGYIMGNNMKVGVIFFAVGLVPPLFLLLMAVNGMMLGTYTAVAGHWGQAGAISSILWCHGTLELQAFVFAGAGGMILLRAWVAPGAWSRKEAMRIESQRALRILAPMFPMLFAAGLIESYVSPHAPTGVRYAVAIITGVMLVAWMLFAGRRSSHVTTMR